MAHAAPARAGTTTGAEAHRRLMVNTGLAVVLGALYGYWTAGRERGGGPITADNLALGIVTGILFAAIWLALRTAGPRLPREQRALAWFTFLGIALGYLYSVTGASVLRSTIMGGLIAAGIACALFYWYYTHEND
ncbi:hypothetical protein [Streptomyces sp. NPDC002851]